MGNPQHFSLELPQRCLRLIDQLWPAANRVFPEHRKDLGPLTATFLLSMSMPIINLPIERMERHKSATGEGYADDRHLNGEVVKELNKRLGGHPARQAPFFDAAAWRYHRAPPPMNISRGLPQPVAEALLEEQAVAAAGALPGSQWCSILRNALAHGGIAYLSGDGRSLPDAPVTHFAFISGIYERTDTRHENAIGYHVLRISEEDYLTFLKLWVRWLVRSGVARAVEEEKQAA